MKHVLTDAGLYQADDLALLDMHGDAAEGIYIAVGLLDIAQFDNPRGHGRLLS